MYNLHDIPPRQSRMVELYVGYTRDDTSRSISMLPCPPLNFKANEEAYLGFSPSKGIKQNRGVQQLMYAIFSIINACAGSRRSLAVIYNSTRIAEHCCQILSIIKLQYTMRLIAMHAKDIHHGLGMVAVGTNTAFSSRVLHRQGM